MRSKHLLLMLLLALMAPWAAMAQTVTIGTSTTTSQNWAPIDNFYNYSFVEMLFSPDEIAAGNPTVNTILSLGFNSNNGNYGYDYDITVYMKNVDDATFASTTTMFAVTNDDVYFTGNVGPVDANSWMTFELDRAFTYDPTKALLIAVNKTAGHKEGTSSQYPGSTYKWNYTETTGSTVLMAHRDGSAYAPATTLPSPASASNYSAKNRPNTQIIFGTPSTCPKPTLSNEVTTTSSTATISWTPSGENQTLFDIYWSATNTAPTDATTPSAADQTGTSYTINGLNSATTYYAWIRGNCGTAAEPNYTSWTSAVSFTTACGVYNIPYTYDFEEAAPFSCWTVIQGAARNYGDAHGSSSYSLKFSGYTSNMIVLPQFAQNTNTLRVEFWTKPESSGGSSGKFAIGYMTNLDDATTFVPVETYNSTAWTSTPAYEKKVVDLTDAPANAYLAMRQFDCATYYYWFVDDVTVKAIPTCFEPTGLAEVENTATSSSVTMQWTAVSNENTWKLQYKKTTDEEWITVPSVTTKPYQITGLDASTLYQVRVAAWCDPADPEAVSDYCEPVTVATACEAITTFPWTENFESYSAGDFIDPCWVNEHISGDGTYIFQVFTDSNGSNTTHQLRLPDMTSGTMTKLVLPAMTLPAGYQFVIDVYRNTNTSSYAEEGIRVFASTDGEIAGATQLAFISRNYTVSDGGLIPAEAASNWYTYELPIGITGTCYIILRGESKYGSSTYMDNFVVEPVPSCARPTGFAATNVTNYSATLGWTAAEGQNAWQIAYKKGSSFNPNDPDLDWTTITTFDVMANSYTFNGTLDFGSTYYMYVRGNCGTDGYSKWSSVCSFTTKAQKPKPTTLTTANVLPTSLDLGWTAGGGDNEESWDIYYANSSTSPSATATPTISGVTTNPFHITNLESNKTYYFWVRSNYTTDGASDWSSYKYQKTPEPCPKPTSLATSEATPNSLKLNWTAGAEWQTSWTIAYSTTSGFDATDPTTCTYIEDVTEKPYVVEGLGSDVTYYFKVKGACGTEYGPSEWSTQTSGKTLVACPKPTNLAANNITHTTADLTWTGYSDSYTVEYQTAKSAIGFYEEFDGTSCPEGWTMYTGLLTETAGTATATLTSSGYAWSFGSGNGVFDNHARVNIYNNNQRWLVTPKIEVTGNTLSFDMALTKYSGNLQPVDQTLQQDDKFIVLISTDNMETWTILREWNNSGSSYVYNNITCSAEGEQVSINLNDYVGQTVHIAFYGESTNPQGMANTGGDNNLHIDNVLCGTIIPAGSWDVAADNVNDEAYPFENLSMGTKYNVRVTPNCGGGETSAVYTFTTYDNNTKIFKTEGNWDVAGNWEGGIPSIENNAIIRANVTIDNGTVATAKKITFEGSTTPTLTINDGGQLKTDNYVTATVKKSITGYTGSKDHYYLIGNPLYYNYISVYNPDNTYNIRKGTYDLYSWSRTSELEWSYYGAENNNTLYMYSGTGYLYANAADVELTFTGTVYANNIPLNSPVGYTEPTAGTTDFSDWNLLANPFVCDAYLVDASENGNALPYYKMNDAGDGFTAVSNGAAVAPMQGIFYKATAAGTVYCTRTAPGAKGGQLNMNLRRGSKQLDNAILAFGSEQKLEKFSFRANSSKIYMPVEGKDYAITNTEAQGEMPVSFKAEKNGSYTLSFSNENVEFGYLHLIDNMTGEDVNLLETPSYSFEAKTTDYASRFKLVFSTGNGVNDESFAFISDGNIILNGEGMLQVVDVMGRIMMQEENATSVSTNGMTPGVYVLRLINGDSVRTQKIVVK